VDDSESVQSSIHPRNTLPEQVDNRFVLRTVEQGTQGLGVETNTVLLTDALKFIPGKRTYALSMIWNSYVFLAKVDQGPVSTSTTALPSTSLLEDPTTNGSGRANSQTAAQVEEWIVANTEELYPRSNRVSDQAPIPMPTSERSSTNATPLSRQQRNEEGQVGSTAADMAVASESLADKSASNEPMLWVPVTMRRPIRLNQKPAGNDQTSKPKCSRDLDELVGASAQMNLMDNEPEDISDDDLDEFFDAPETSEHASEGEGSEQSMDISAGSTAKDGGSAKGSTMKDFGSARESTMKDGGSAKEFMMQDVGSAKDWVKVDDAESERVAGPDIQTFIPAHIIAQASEDAGEAPNEVDESEQLYLAVREILKLAVSHHGDVGWRIRLGRVLSSVNGNFDRYPFAAKHFDEVVAKLLKGQPTFTNL
jgi:hypothetical protein